MKGSPIFPKDDNGCLNEFGYHPHENFSKRTMKGSPVFLKDDEGCLDEFGYPPLENFSKLLEAARKHRTEVNSKSWLPSSNSVEKSAVMEDRKRKRSWKQSLFFWRKSERKRAASHPEAATETSKSCRASNPKPGPVSGPISGDGGGVGCASYRKRGPVSGPISGDGGGAGCAWNPKRGSVSGPISVDGWRVSCGRSLRGTASMCGDGGRGSTSVGQTASTSAGDGGREGVVHGLGRTASGRFLARLLFTPTRAEESEVPYMSLDHQNQPRRTKSFGPIYLVT